MILVLIVMVIVIFAFFCGLPDYIEQLDEEIKAKHRTPVKPRLPVAPKKKHLKRVK